MGLFLENVRVFFVVLDEAAAILHTNEVARHNEGRHRAEPGPREQTCCRGNRSRKIHVPKIYLDEILCTLNNMIWRIFSK